MRLAAPGERSTPGRILGTKDRCARHKGICTALASSEPCFYLPRRPLKDDVRRQKLGRRNFPGMLGMAA